MPTEPEGNRLSSSICHTGAGEEVPLNDLARIVTGSIFGLRSAKFPDETGLFVETLNKKIKVFNVLRGDV